MRDQYTQTGTRTIPNTLTLNDSASLENHVRLQQSQSEFLDWLNTNEQLAVVDRYSYRKIR